MRISTKLYASMVLCLGVIILISLTLVQSARDVHASLARNKVVNRLVQGIIGQNILTFDYVLYQEERARTQWQAKHAALGALLHEASAQGTDEALLWQRIHQNHEVITKLFTNLVTYYEQGGKEAGENNRFGELETRLTSQLLSRVQTKVSDAAQLSEMSYADALAAQDRARTLITLCTAGIGVLVAGTFVLTRQSVLKPLARLREGMEIISAGNLEHQLSMTRRDEIGAVSQAFDQMTTKLNASYTLLNGEIRGAAGDLTSATREILAATTQQVAGVAGEAAAVQQTVTTVAEVKQMAHLAAQNAQVVAAAAQQMTQVAQAGRQAVEASVQEMQAARERMEALARRILTLSEQGQAISAIIDTVNTLAGRSNLLAVNAAIEAAKAGEVGWGFAVVAAEIKGLAEQSKQATEQVREILGEIQGATHAVVMAAEDGVKAVETGAGVAAEAGQSIVRLTQSVLASAQAAQQIVASVQQQVTGVEQVAGAMQQLQQGATQSMAATRQVERAAQDLTVLARRLQGLVGGNGTDAILAGGTWVESLGGDTPT